MKFPLISLPLVGRTWVRKRNAHELLVLCCVAQLALAPCSVITGCAVAEQPESSGSARQAKQPHAGLTGSLANEDSDKSMTEQAKIVLFRASG